MEKIPKLTIVKRNAPKEEQPDEMLPMEQWDGSAWKAMFDFLAQTIPEQDPWDSLAAFIKATLMRDPE